MSTGFDSPSGRMDTIPSSLTGGMLRYFTPYPLTELLDRSTAFASDISPIKVDFFSSLPLLISGVLSFRGGQFERRQSALLVDIALGSIRVQTLPDLLEVGRGLGIRAPELRKEMVYADAPIPSLASVIFAHHEAVPALMNSLADGMSREALDIHPYLRAITVGFFCAHVHPFLDGNGRWSRTVAAATGAGSQAYVESYVAALYMSACKEELARDVWIRARAYGLREYFERAMIFRAAFFEGISMDLVDDTEKIFAVISEFSKTKSCRREMLKTLFSKGGIDAESIKSVCGVSRKLADGRISVLRTIAQSYAGDGSVSCVRPPWRTVLQASDHARCVAMEKYQ